MKLQAVINRLMGTTKPIIKTSTRKWPKCVKAQKYFISEDGNTAVKVDKNNQIVRILTKLTLEDDFEIMVPVKADHKGRPVRVTKEGALECPITVTTRVQDKDTKEVRFVSSFDYYQVLIGKIYTNVEPAKK